MPPQDGLCANLRCKKGPDGTRGAVKSQKSKVLLRVMSGYGLSLESAEVGAG